MDSITDKIKNLELLVQSLEDDIEKIQNSIDMNESNYQKLEKEIKQLDLDNLYKDGKISFDVLCSNTKKYPILDDFLEECSKIYPFIPDSNLLEKSCIKCIEGQTNHRTIELLLRMGAKPNFKFRDRFCLVSGVFDLRTNKFRDDIKVSIESYKIIAPILLINGYKPSYDIFYTNTYLDDLIDNEKEIKYIEFWIQKIHKDDMKKIIEDIIDHKDLFYDLKYRNFLLKKIFEVYPGMIKN